jgi:FdhD protein
VRLHGRPFAVIMRTPGADRELAAGFLLSERVIASADDLGTIEHCRDVVRPTPDPARGPAGDAQVAHPENIINVTLAGRSPDELERMLDGRRQTLTSSSCGLCGRLTIQSLQLDVAPLPIDRRVLASVVSSLPRQLREAQKVFDETGGLHAAGLFALDGELAACAEDVGRHNAVDKVVGGMLMRDALPLSERVLFVSGRTSFEIVQKALVAGIPIVGSVSAPSSLAIDLACAAGITLVGFVRGDSFNIYAHPDRVV